MLKNITEAQHKQLEWVDKGEFDYTRATRIHDVYCADCKTGHAFGAPGSVRTFIIKLHPGHNTKYFARSC